MLLQMKGRREERGEGGRVPSSSSSKGGREGGREGGRARTYK